MIRLLASAVLGAAVLLSAGCAPQTTPQAKAPAEAAAKTPYGANKAAGATFTHDGVTLYYETYGQGEPLLLIHGNGGSIGTMAAQIEHFRKDHRVIAMDSRDHGRSGDSAGPITYEKMADDQAALLDHLKAGPADVVGWSDGGIEALLLGLRHPAKVRKLVAMAANLNPQAVYPETDKLTKDMFAQLATMPDGPEKRRGVKLAELLIKEPHIDPASLAKVTAPTLVVSGDSDLIRLDHTVQIFESLPNANLAVLPNSTHAVPYDDPQLFNATVDRFLKTPFRKKDRIADTMASVQKAMAGLAK
jgi:pimeloyl-ACP methyl ester carboxylesterase